MDEVVLSKSNQAGRNALFNTACECLCVCLCLCACVCMPLNVFACVSVCVHICACVSVCVRVFGCVCGAACLRVCVPSWVHVCLCGGASCAHVRACARACVRYRLPLNCSSGSSGRGGLPRRRGAVKPSYINTRSEDLCFPTHSYTNAHTHTPAPGTCR